ncbi:hypothetical protein BASH2_04761 [Bacillus anthracis]|nr:hypothetical protein BASH2_04761 [Bacillus anthracis]
MMGEASYKLANIPLTFMMPEPAGISPSGMVNLQNNKDKMNGSV